MMMESPIKAKNRRPNLNHPDPIKSLCVTPLKSSFRGAFPHGAWNVHDVFSTKAVFLHHVTLGLDPRIHQEIYGLAEK